MAVKKVPSEAGADPRRLYDIAQTYSSLFLVQYDDCVYIGAEKVVKLYLLNRRVGSTKDGSSCCARVV